MWSRLSKKSKALVVALLAILSGWSVIKAQLVDPLWSAYSHRQPAHDERLISDLRAGISFAEFEKRVGEASIAVIDNEITFRRLDKPVHGRDELFLLDTVYLEAFVDDNQTVLGYTVTTRTGDTPITIDVAGREYRLNSMTAAQAEIPVDRVVALCGAHVYSYYEVSGTSNAQLNQTTAVGLTSTGYVGEGFFPTGCPPGAPSEIDSLPLYLPPDQTAMDRRYPIPQHLVTNEYLQHNSSYRAKLVINAVSITAPGVDLPLEMISLHPSTVSNYT